MPRLRFSLRGLFAATCWTALWAFAYAINPALSAPALWPVLAILPFTALGAVLGEALVGTVVGFIVVCTAFVFVVALG